MTLLDEVSNGLGAALLPIMTGLLLEELTLGGLVRLLIVPWPKSKKKNGPVARPSPPAASTTGPNHADVRNGEQKCSH